MAAQRASKCLDEETLASFAGGRLDSTGLSNVESHLADCAVCQATLTRLALGSDTAITAGFDASGSVQTAQTAIECDAFLKAPVAHRAIPPLGSMIDERYRVDHVLGRGGMGSVIAATHIRLRQRVAIKVLKLAGKQAKARFLREGRTLAQLNHQHIVRVYDSGELPNGLPYIVMEYLEGTDLAKSIAQRAIPISDAVSYARQACEALAAAHAAGFVHRDLKPSNLFLARQSGATSIKVLDFGISKSLLTAAAVSDTSMASTGPGDVIGSPRYMSPEQLKGQPEVDERTDVWSLGVILYELLTGVPPFDQREFAAVAIAIATERPKPPCAHRPQVPEGLQSIVLRCLHKDPAQRFQSVIALDKALAPYSTCTSDSQLSAAVRRPTGMLGLAGKALLILGTVLLFSGG